MGNLITIRIAGNTPRWGEHPFPEGATLGQVFDHIGGSPRDQFRPSHTLVVRRWHKVRPHSVTLPLANASSRGFQLLDKDLVIYQYDLEPSANAG